MYSVDFQSFLAFQCQKKIYYQRKNFQVLVQGYGVPVMLVDLKYEYNMEWL